MEKQLFICKVAPKKELMEPIQNGGFVKADGGLWTSTFKNGGSEWVDYSHRVWGKNQFKRWVLTVREDVKIYKIDSYHDLEKAYEKYGYLWLGFKPLLNFEEMEKDGYDGVWLTHKGQRETRNSRPIDLYGWDIESTHWFRWVFDKVEELGELTIKI